MDSRLTTSIVCFCFLGEFSVEVSSMVTIVMSFVGDCSELDCSRFQMLLTIISTLVVDFMIPFGWVTFGSAVYEHDGSFEFLGEFDRFEFKKSFGIDDATISYDVPGESEGILNTLKVGENFKVVVSSEVMLLFSEELEYRSFRAFSCLVSEISLHVG